VFESKKMRWLTSAWVFLGLQSMTQFAMAATPTDACALLPQQEVATLLGVSVEPGQHKISASDCRWTEPGRSIADGAALQLNVTDAQAFEIGKTLLVGWNKKPESGLADDAYFVDSGKVYFLVSPTLSVKKGSVFFVVAVKIPGASLEQTKAIEKTVATKILGKL
jgi:hypothetical protein